MKWPQAFIVISILVTGLSCKDFFVKSKEGNPIDANDKNWQRPPEGLPKEKDSILHKNKKPLKKFKKSRPQDTLKPRMAHIRDLKE
ncbi:hypothetical protein [Maribacter sp. 2210JD10-5]|uniref:hypothetical protein n=1 Tax=Maribacter sp. 2210JD10-5 TaxID=3386272 RepID=UPI0039BC7572